MTAPWWKGLTLNKLYGKRMRLVRETHWRDIVIPAGSLITLGLTQTRWDALHFTLDPCPHCGTKWRANIPCSYIEPIGE